jgi:murein endopeptidase/LysM repeat protein
MNPATPSGRPSAGLVCGWRFQALLGLTVVLFSTGWVRAASAPTPDASAPARLVDPATDAPEPVANDTGDEAEEDSGEPAGDDAAIDEDTIEESPAPENSIVLDESEVLDSPANGTASGEGIPAAETLREMIAGGPESLGALSIGTPDAGALLNGVQMSDGPLWKIRDARDAWATEETVAFLEGAIEAAAAQYPGSTPIVIGDLSRRAGGSAGRHRSHQSGRDADLGWYFKDSPGESFANGTATNLDLPRCWALVRALVTETDIERIFMDRSIQRLLFGYALDAGEDRGWLDSIFASPGGRGDTLVQHVRRHKNHLHVRFYNRRAQEWGRVAYPLLVEARLLPPPVIMYRVRPGDTLSTIARRHGARVSAIRAANGLRSSFIRAGRRYRIPVRLAAARFVPPVIVPPRRLPPATSGRIAESAAQPASGGGAASVPASSDSQPLAQAP